MLKLTHDYKFWFVAGSQFLYGEEQLKNVARDAEDIVKKLNASGKLPYPIEFKGVMTTADGITQFMKDVNYNDDVAGVITWMHTFSPAKNWIRGTKLLQKPLLHLATQYLDKIPYDTIDFDYSTATSMPVSASTTRLSTAGGAMKKSRMRSLRGKTSPSPTTRVSASRSAASAIRCAM